MSSSLQPTIRTIVNSSTYIQYNAAKINNANGRSCRNNLHKLVYRIRPNYSPLNKFVAKKKK